MGAFGNIFARKEPHSVAQNKAFKNKSDLVVERAKNLIEDLVSPLSEPNQRVIDEVLGLIAQTSSLPDSLVNKEAVQKTLKDLLFQLVEPMSNPNKQLIDELLQLVVRSDKFDVVAKSQPVAAPSNVQKAELEHPKEEQSDVAGISDGKVRQLRGNTALRHKQMEASSQAPFPTGDPFSMQREKETKSIMNLLLEQIKELITITNNLNTKIKSQQVRLDTLDTNLAAVKKKSQEFNDRMVAFEKNMEKFIGLYEVVTNQYNPFVENAAEFSSQNFEQGGNSPYVENVLNRNPLQRSTIQQVQQKPTLSIGANTILDLHQLGDVLISIPEDKFDEQVISKKQDMIRFVKETLGKPQLAEELKNAVSKTEITKLVVKHSYL